MTAADGSISLTATLGVTLRDAWVLLMDAGAQQQWIGAGTAVTRPSNRVALAGPNGPWRRGRLRVADEAAGLLEMTLGGAPDWPAGTSTVLRVRLRPDGDSARNRTTLTLHESADGGSYGDLVAADIRSFWQEALDRLEELARAVAERRRPAQAIVLIHGIGDQVPGQTLASFVETVLDAAPGARVYSKPDRASGSLELRRLTVAERNEMPKTDFYEYSWAHHVSGTTPGQVLGWMRGLLLRSGPIPAQLRPAWFVGRLAALLLVGGLGALVYSVLRAEGLLGVVSALSLVLSVALAILGGVFVKNLGDAARYLSARPANVEARETVRNEGIRLLANLHDCGRYHRIVVVGHSLGSVIAYDIVNHLWSEMHERHLRPPKTLNKRNRLLHLYQDDDVDEAQRLQHEAWQETRRNTQPWLITDLVTLGSPLAHADLLMVRDEGEFTELVKRRELPTAPPVRDERADEDVAAFWRQESYTSRDGGRFRTFRILHHAAPFAITRWTNLYFPARYGVFGDPIGGPLGRLFGGWVLDRRVDAPAQWTRRRRLWLHSCYWLPGGNGEAADFPLPSLRAALRLDGKSALLAETAEHPAYMYLREPDW